MDNYEDFLLEAERVFQVKFEEDSDYSLRKPLNLMQKNFLKLPQVKRQPKPAKALFWALIKKYLEQIGPLFEKDTPEERKTLIPGLFWSLASAQKMSQHDEREWKQKKNKFAPRLRKDIKALIASRKTLGVLRTRWKKYETSPIAYLIIPIGKEGFAAVEKAYIELGTAIKNLKEQLAAYERPGPAPKNMFQGYVMGLFLDLEKRMPEKELTVAPLGIRYNGEPDKQTFELKEKTMAEKFNATPSRLMANGYFLAGLSEGRYKEANLRKILQKCKETLGFDYDFYFSNKK